VGVALVVAVIMTYVFYKITHSRWSWVPGLVLGLVAGTVFR
jgi:riboflavin transporter FmnP